MPDDIKDRLKRAREAAGLTRAELARKTGRSQSTIRAHENGQNNLQPDVARIYADALGVRPEWLLYAANPPPDKLTVTSDLFTMVDVAGAIRNGYFIRPGESADLPGPKQIVVPRFAYSNAGLVAYMDRSDDVMVVSQRRYLLTVPARPGYMKKRDEVVLSITEGRNVETGLWHVISSNTKYGFARRSGIDSVADMSFPRGKDPDPHIRILGVVVGRIELSFEKPSWEWDVRTSLRDLMESEEHNRFEMARAAEEEAEQELQEQAERQAWLYPPDDDEE